MTVNAADRRSIRQAEKASRQAERQDDEVVFALMSHVGGRAWMHRRLVEAHIFTNPFSTDTHLTAFGCGEMNMGQRLLAGIMRACPDQYVPMMREANARDAATEQRTGGKNADRGTDGQEPADGDGEASGDFGYEARDRSQDGDEAVH